jgi:hypothetical protein
MPDEDSHLADQTRSQAHCPWACAHGSVRAYHREDGFACSAGIVRNPLGWSTSLGGAVNALTIRNLSGGWILVR